eukprot:jgi/Mesvir1/6512/Mv25653-RA.1
MSAGIPFNVVNNAHFKAALSAISRGGVQYLAPSSQTMRTRDAPLVAKDLERDVKEKTQLATGTRGTFITDGWKDCSRESHIMNVFHLPTFTYFIGSDNVTGQVKSAEFMADLAEPHILAVGAANVVQVITDTTTSMENMKKLLEASFPHIIISRCCAHSLDLCFQDIGKEPAVDRVLTQVNTVVVFMLGHEKINSFFHGPGQERQDSQEVRRHPLWHQVLLGGERSRRQDPAHGHLRGRRVGEVCRGAAVVARVQAGPGYCGQPAVPGSGVRMLVDIFKPMKLVLKIFDSDKPATGELYYMMYELLKAVQDIRGLHKDLSKQLQVLVRRRWALHAFHHPRRWLRAQSQVLGP